MRRWFVLLMVVLLPLRAVAGDFMSVGTALADNKPATSAGMSPDCLMHVAASDDDPADDTAKQMSTADCGSCALCLPVAQAEPIAIGGPDRLVDTRPVVGDDRYASAVALGLLRPPKL